MIREHCEITIEIHTYTTEFQNEKDKNNEMEWEKRKKKNDEKIITESRTAYAWIYNFLHFIIYFFLNAYWDTEMRK